MRRIFSLFATVTADHAQSSDRPHSFWIAILIGLALLSVSWWGQQQHATYHHADGAIYHHPDEPIASGVVSGMVKNRSWDTNWALYDVGQFRFDEYNFSSYYLSLSIIAQAAKTFGLPFGLVQMRIFSAVFAALCVLLAYLIGNKVSGRVAGVAAAAITAICSQLYQDSLYARPETFLTLLTLLASYVAVSAQGRSLWRLSIASALVGLMIACKISAALFVLMPLAVFFGSRQARNWIGPIFVSLGATIVGIVIGAPEAPLHPSALLHGVRVLLNQYNVGPGAAAAGPLDQSLLNIRGRLVNLSFYLIPTIGIPAIAMAAFGAVKTFRKRRYDVLAILCFSAVSILYLGTRGQFYERNFSHTLPLMFVSVGVGLAWAVDLLGPSISARAGLSLAAAAICYFPATITFRIMHDVLSGGYERQVQSLQNLAIAANPGLPLVGWPNLTYGDAYTQMRDYLASTQGPFLLEVLDHDDRLSRETIQRFLSDYKAVEIATLPSPFCHISPSSLQVYLAQTHRIYRVDAAHAR